MVLFSTVSSPIFSLILVISTAFSVFGAAKALFLIRTHRALGQFALHGVRTSSLVRIHQAITPSIVPILPVAWKMRHGTSKPIVWVQLPLGMCALGRGSHNACNGLGCADWSDCLPPKLSIVGWLHSLLCCVHRLANGWRVGVRPGRESES